MPKIKLKKQFWKEKKTYDFFCPVCKSARKIALNPRFGSFFHWLQMIMFSLFLCICFWRVFAWKGIFLFFPIWTLAEMIHRFRLRSTLECSQCGFDPYMFLANRKKSIAYIQAHLSQKMTGKPRLENAIPRSPPEQSAAPNALKKQ